MGKLKETKQTSKKDKKKIVTNAIEEVKRTKIKEEKEIAFVKEEIITKEEIAKVQDDVVIKPKVEEPKKELKFTGRFLLVNNGEVIKTSTSFNELVNVKQFAFHDAIIVKEME